MSMQEMDPQDPFGLLTGLNDEQKEAVTTTEGYVRVIAGAGSGKTRALSHRYSYLVQMLGVSTANILCITFTNKAAREMKQRIHSLVGDMDTGYVCTFHSFCLQLLREDIHVLNYPENFAVLDTDDTETILKKIYEDQHISSAEYTFKMIRDEITAFKYAMKHIPYFARMDNRSLKECYEQAEDTRTKIILGYLYEQKKNFGLDFDDLITIALHVLKTYPDKREKWQKRMMYVMVDEFQDVSKANYELAEILSGYHKNLFIVGDPDQTIYSWRGADIAYILHFDTAHPGTKTIKLYKNYRSTPNILNAANSLIENNKNRIPNELVAVKDAHVITVYNHSKTARMEAEWAAAEIKRLKEAGASYQDVCILYRSHFVSRSFEEAFVKEQIPYVIYSGIEFYKRKEIKDILSYMRMVAVGDDLSFMRSVNEPRRGIGKKRIAYLTEYAEDHDCTLYEALMECYEDAIFTGTGATEYISVIEKYRELMQDYSLSDVLAGLLNDSGYEAMLRQMGEDERLENLAEFKESVFQYEKESGEFNTLEEYLQDIALFTNTDKKEDADSVKLMTIHIAKGLEYPYVFLVGLNEGIFPTKHADTPEKLEEERRLAYVAYTRAETALFLTDSEGINFDGSTKYPSRFIFNTDEKYLEYRGDLEQSLINSAKRHAGLMGRPTAPAEPEGYKAGDRVSHLVFGEGVVLAADHAQKILTVKFEKLETERNLAFNSPVLKKL